MQIELPDKSVIAVGDEVSCAYQGCAGHTFVIDRIHATNSSYSKFMVVAHLKEDKSREIQGTIIDGVNYGIDASWFKRIE